LTYERLEMATQKLSDCSICNGPLTPLSVVATAHIRGSIQKFGYGVCHGCDFAQAAVVPSAELLRDYYAANSQLRREFLTAQESFHIEKQISFVLRYARATTTVLEYGPDMGHFLELLRSRRPSDSFYFSEYNEQATSYLLRQGFKVFDGRRADLIVARHVFEHVPNPVEWLSSLGTILDDAGLVFIEVPDYTVISVNNCDPFHFEHLSYFTLGSIQKAAKKSGFSIRAVERDQTPGYSVSNGYVIRVILQKQPKESDLGTWELLSNEQQNTFERFSSRIREAKSKGKIVAIYGAGTLSKQLSTNSDLENCVSVIYDADPKKIGMSLFGSEIKDANAVNASDFDVMFVTLLSYKEEVRDFLKSRLIDDSKVEYFY
jgi:hypothetical protein